MFLLSKVFRWDLCMVSTASVANIGGSASAPIIAVAYHESYAGIGVLMAIFVNGMLPGGFTFGFMHRFYVRMGIPDNVVDEFRSAPAA